MSGYDSAGGASSTFGGPSTSTAAGTSNAGGGGTKRRRVNADPDFYPGAAPTTKRAQANWKAAQEQAQIRNAQAMQQQQQDAQLANAAAGGAGLSQQGSRMHVQADAQQPRQPILSLATLPPEALQRYLSRYGLIDPAGLLSFHHAVFPVPPLPETLHPPLEGPQLNVRKAKMTYIPAARNAKIHAARAAAGLPAPGTADEPASGGEVARADVQGGAGAEGGADAAGSDATAGGTNATGGRTDGAKPSADASATPSLGGASPTVQRPAVSTSTTSRPWLEPKTPEFAGLSAFDNPDVVLSRLAARATQHWDKRESLKEAETLTNFMFSVRNRGRTLRATPAG